MVKFGIRNCYYAPITSRASAGYTYGTPVALEGATELTLEPVGDKTDIYADDKIVYSVTPNQGYSGTLTLTAIPDDFLTAIMGATSDSDSGIKENQNDEVKHFALGFEIQTDEKARRMWLYDCVASRSGLTARTQTQSVEVDTDALNITCTPRLDTSDVRYAMQHTSANETKYNSFFSAVI